MGDLISGIVLCSFCSVAAYLLAIHLPIGSVSLVILLGIIVGNLLRLPTRFQPGIQFSEKTILTWAIALMGLGLDYTIVSTLGLQTVFIVVSAVLITILTALVLGWFFRVDGDLALLVGIGNAVCGSSAIAAAQGVIRTKEKHVGVSIAVINLLGTFGIFLLLGIVAVIPDYSEQQAAVLIGNTLQAVGQVSAAGFSVSDRVGELATVVKLVRVLLITPVVLILSWNFRTQKGAVPARKSHFPVQVPWYIIAFIGFSAVRSGLNLSSEFLNISAIICKALLMVAMAAIGMKIQFRDLASGGRSALTIGSITFGIQVLFSVVVVYLLV